MKLIVTVAMLAVALTRRSGAQQPAPTAAQWRADLLFLDAAIRRVHPAPFHRVSEQAYTRAVAALSRAIPGLRPRQIAARFAGIVTLLNDGHSRVVFEDSLFRPNVAFPVRIDRFPDGIRVVAATSQARDLLGARVARFGRLSGEAAWDSLSSISSGDNLFSRWSAVPWLATLPGLLEALGLSPEDSLSLVAVTDRGDTLRRTIAHQDTKPDRSWLLGGWTGPAGTTETIARFGAEAPVSERNRGDTYWYLVQGRQLYAQVNAVQNAGGPVHLGDRTDTASFAGFTERVLARLDAGGIDRMVLDLRYNSGGNNGLVKAMVAGLAARPAINQQGRLFVITGRTTYSAAMNFVSLLEDRTEALFVGEPPGGAPRHYGDATRFTLPNSHLPVMISTLRWEIGVQPMDVRQVMAPDLPAPPTVAALLSGQDPAMDAIDRYPGTATLSERLLAAYRTGGLAAARAAYSGGRSAALAPWNDEGQQLVAFGYATFPLGRGRQELFDLFAWITEVAPTSAEAWVARGRVHGFVGDWAAARDAYRKAAALRPNDELIRRFLAVAERR